MCSKSSNNGSSAGTTTPQQVSFTSNDATSAYNDFNKYLFDTTRKIYYRASDKSGIGAIWTQAVYFDMSMNAWKRTQNAKYRQMIEDIYDGAAGQYNNYNWHDDSKWFIWDDMMWWIIALGRAYQTTGEQKFLDHSKEGFNFVWYGDSTIGRKGSHESNGGMEWDWHQRGKTACINFPTIIGAMTLYNITKDTQYVAKAKEVYGWARTNLCDANGILPYETGEEQGVYNAILAQYIIRLIEDGSKPDYLPWLRKNINTAYGNRNSTTGLMGKDYKTTPATGAAVSCYDACSIPALMQVTPPEK
jgi:predicted alpha-1,6-mannanase (GH76 family)